MKYLVLILLSSALMAGEVTPKTLYCDQIFDIDATFSEMITLEDYEELYQELGIKEQMECVVRDVPVRDETESRGEVGPEVTVSECIKYEFQRKCGRKKVKKLFCQYACAMTGITGCIKEQICKYIDKFVEDCEDIRVCTKWSPISI